MRLPKSLSNAVMFARWCQENAMDPPAAARLVVLARRAFRAAELACSQNRPGLDERDEAATNRFKAAAAELGYGVQWSGLWPTLQRDGRNVYLPSMD